VAIRTDAKKNQNTIRAEWARRVTTKFQNVTGLTDADGLDTAVVDLLCDLAHLCDEAGLEFERLLDRAMVHYDAEGG